MEIFLEFSEYEMLLSELFDICFYIFELIVHIYFTTQKNSNVREILILFETIFITELQYLKYYKEESKIKASIVEFTKYQFEKLYT